MQNAFNHWKKHGKNFPDLLNSKQYVEATKDSIKNPKPHVLKRTNKNGDSFFYDPIDNTFIAVTPEGAPKTMMKPRSKMQYWNNIINRE